MSEAEVAATAKVEASMRCVEAGCSTTCWSDPWGFVTERCETCYATWVVAKRAAAKAAEAAKRAAAKAAKAAEAAKADVCDEDGCFNTRFSRDHGVVRCQDCHDTHEAAAAAAAEESKPKKERKTPATAKKEDSAAAECRRKWQALQCVPADVVLGPSVHNLSPPLTCALADLHAYFSMRKSEILDMIAAKAGKGDGRNLHKNGSGAGGGIIHAPFKRDAKGLMKEYTGGCDVTMYALPLVNNVFQIIRKCLTDNMPSWTDDMDAALCDQAYNTPDNRVDEGALTSLSRTGVKCVVACSGDVGQGDGAIILTQLSKAYLNLSWSKKSNDSKRHQHKFQVKRVAYDASGQAGAAMTMTSCENLGTLHAYLDGTTGVSKDAPNLLCAIHVLQVLSIVIGYVIKNTFPVSSCIHHSSFLHLTSCLPYTLFPKGVPSAPGLAYDGVYRDRPVAEHGRHAHNGSIRSSHQGQGAGKAGHPGDPEAPPRG
jgi:hypothetical protein